MADVGLRVRNQSGYIETTVTTRLTKIIGKYDIPLYDAVFSSNSWRAPAAANGGLVINEFSGGTPFFYFLANGQRSFWGMLMPSVTISGNSLTWKWVDAAVNFHVRAELFNSANANVNAVGGISLVYGVYS